AHPHGARRGLRLRQATGLKPRMHAWNTRWRFPLYLRIWLAVVVTVGLLTVAFSWLWRINAEQQERPARELIIRNEAGEIVGQTVLRSNRRDRAQGFEFDV